MGKQIAVSLLLIFLIFFLPWLWGGPARAPEPRPEPQPAEDLPPQPEEDDPAPDSGSREPGRDSTTVLNLLADGRFKITYSIIRLCARAIDPSIVGIDPQIETQAGFGFDSQSHSIICKCGMCSGLIFFGNIVEHDSLEVVISETY